MRKGDEACEGRGKLIEGFEKFQFMGTPPRNFYAFCFASLRCQKLIFFGHYVDIFGKGRTHICTFWNVNVSYENSEIREIPASVSKNFHKWNFALKGTQRRIYAASNLLRASDRPLCAHPGAIHVQLDERNGSENRASHAHWGYFQNFFRVNRSTSQRQRNFSKKLSENGKNLAKKFQNFAFVPKTQRL